MFRASAPLLRRNYSPSTLSSSPLHSTDPRLFQSPAKIHGSIFQSHRFQTNPFRKLGTLSENPTQSSSKPREKSGLVEAFESAKTTEEMIRVFKDMETMEGCFDKRVLGIASLKIGRKIKREEKYDHLSISSFQTGVEILERLKKEDLISTEDIKAIYGALHSEEFVSDAEYSRYRNWDQVLESWGVGSESIRAKIKAANKQIKSGKHDEAVYDLVRIVERAEEDSEDRALAFVLMGKALFLRGNIDDSSKWFEVACGILDKKSRAFPIEVYIQHTMR
ncbi:hypothetical protein F3Y22_tig00110607pilonHSYRG00188 [Hibiscus syriacus]|uniref:Uncharacterized protein n=1 Tax=Hibiscus syriacus TaxID=106335 RepID=A0A6A3A3Z4_HIBSY|nr:hypothetical protein F3Y22_tig00110607pilonHSYRG00188 [Hibiscus syriacus]